MDDWDDPSLSYDGQPAAPLAPLSGTPLGRGAQGVVVSGQDRHLPREVAWKSASRSDPKACLRLRHEARVLAMLEHPNIVPVYDLDDLGSHLRMALRYVRGASLRTLLRREPFAPGSVRAIRHVLAVAHALAFAHLRGVVHRDVKPDNIMVGEQGETQLIDWGLAAVLEDHDPVGGVTGTPLYMSPEQARGERPTPSVDVWALGAILYELAIGRPLWALAATPIESGEIASDAKPILEELRLGRRPHLDLRSLPEELAAIITRALAPEPEARYHDAGSFADDLEAFLDGRIVAAHTYSRWQRLKRFARRWRLAFGIGLAVLVTLAIGLPVAFLRISDERDDAIAARQEVTRQLARAETTIAQREHEAGRRPEAELAAAKVLALTESPEARGILAAWARAPRPEPLVTVRPPLWPGPCRDVAVSPDGRHALCGHRSGLVVFDLTTSPPSRVFAIERPYFNATLTNRDLWMSHQPGAIMDRVDLETGLRTEHKSCDRNLEAVGEVVLDFDSSCAGVFAASGTLLGLESAPGEHFQTMAADRDLLVVLTTKGDLHVVRPDATRTVKTTLASATRDYVTAALWHGPDRDPYVVFGSSRGHIAVLDLDGQVLFERRLLPERVIRDLDVDDRTSR
ncbi:MAG: serine/threonine protein kinase, partial [Deltaproteobacteria bacterium]|nr:serine/threonine protein kinase [Deltaproteobacteria bacterium]